MRLPPRLRSDAGALGSTLIREALGPWILRAEAASRLNLGGARFHVPHYLGTRLPHLPQRVFSAGRVRVSVGGRSVSSAATKYPPLQCRAIASELGDPVCDGSV